ncbi:MAG: hypothetical protein ACYDAD_07845 [Acidimicrobiales bacterium]
MHNRARVLDSTPICDAVAAQDSGARLRAPILKVLVALNRDDPALAELVRSVFEPDDAYDTPGKPPCD